MTAQSILDVIEHSSTVSCCCAGFFLWKYLPTSGRVLVLNVLFLLIANIVIAYTAAHYGHNLRLAHVVTWIEFAFFASLFWLALGKYKTAQHGVVWVFVAVVFYALSFWLKWTGREPFVDVLYDNYSSALEMAIMFGLCLFVAKTMIDNIRFGDVEMRLWQLNGEQWYMAGIFWYAACNTVSI